MKIMIYSASWCAACRDMADYLKQTYPDAAAQFVPIDQMPADTQEQILAALRKLTWSDQLPVTVIDDTVVLGTDYAALIALLGPGGKSPAGGSAQHRHGLIESGE
jgi:glutaredoxin